MRVVRVVLIGLVLVLLVASPASAHKSWDTLPSSPTAPKTVAMYVDTQNQAGLNLRAKPTTKSRILLTMPYAARVQAEAKPIKGPDGQNWYKVRYKSETGYAYGPLLSKKRPPTTMYVSTEDDAGLNLRAKPNTDSRILLTMPYASRVQALQPVKGTDGMQWYQVRYRSKQGYAAGWLLSKSEPMPQAVNARGVYLPFFMAAQPQHQERIFDMIDRTVLNAVVVDIKSDGGLVWDTNVPTAKQIGAVHSEYDLERLVERAHERDIYVIGRFTVFKDTRTAQAYPGWAISSSEGGLWQDDAENAYVDPFDERAWEYFAQLAVEAARLGVDEIQWDYVRFPVDGDLNTIQVDGEYTEEGRIDQITKFLAHMQSRLRPTGVATSADIFGLTVWHKQENYLGQRLERIIQHVDYVSPMLYPSGFNGGSGGYEVPPAHPYGLIRQSLEKTEARLQGVNVGVRPWLQAFDDYAWGLPYGVQEELAQRRAAEEMGSSGWLFWNPAARYDEGTFAPRP